MLVVRVCTYIYIYMLPPPKIYHFWLFVDVKEVVFVGNILQKPSKYIITLKKTKCTKHTSSGPLLEVEMSKKCTPLWREAHFQVKMYKAPQLRTTFWKLRCRKSARRCGAKHVSKSKCEKHDMLGPLLDVQMSFRVAGARDCAPRQK